MSVGEKTQALNWLSGQPLSTCSLQRHRTQALSRQPSDTSTLNLSCELFFHANVKLCQKKDDDALSIDIGHHNIKVKREPVQEKRTFKEYDSDNIDTMSRP